MLLLQLIRPQVLLLVTGSEKQTIHGIGQGPLLCNRRKKLEGTADAWSCPHSYLLPYKTLSSFLYASLHGENSVHFLSWQFKQIHAELENGASAVEESVDEFPMDHSHERLMAGGPDPIPLAIERIGDGWAEHIVQIHFCDLEEKERRRFHSSAQPKLLCLTPRATNVARVDFPHLFQRQLAN